MLKIIRGLLYGLAIIAGVAGVVSGLVPLVKFSLEYFRDHEFGYYTDLSALYLPGVVILLSLLLLVLVCLCLVAGKALRATAPSPNIAGKSSSAPADALLQPAKETAPTNRESADEKLTRLLSQKQD